MPPYVCITFFTISKQGAVCSTLPAGYNRDDGIHGFEDVVCLATSIHDDDGSTGLPDDYFASWSLKEVGDVAVLYGDGVYHTYGRAEPTWCNSTAEVWRTLKELLKPYQDAPAVFDWLYYAVNLKLGHPVLVKGKGYRDASSLLCPSDMPVVHDRTQRERAKALTLTLKIYDRIVAGKPYDDDEFDADIKASFAMPSYVTQWSTTDTPQRKLTAVRKYFIAVLDLIRAETMALASQSK